MALQYLCFCTRSQYLYVCTSNSRSTSRTSSAQISSKAYINIPTHTYVRIYIHILYILNTGHQQGSHQNFRAQIWLYDIHKYIVYVCVWKTQSINKPATKTSRHRYLKIWLYTKACRHCRQRSGGVWIRFFFDGHSQLGVWVFFKGGLEGTLRKKRGQKITQLIAAKQEKLSFIFPKSWN